jgi:mannose-1-phosphate guanylyltransferase
MGGGIGSRFWPFSREEFPKQFLDFFGSGRSLIQATYDRFAGILPEENIFVVTNERYASLVQTQLPHMPARNILVEPTRRNTAPCIAYAAWHINAVNPDANIVVAPSDHLILKTDVFIDDVRRGLEFVAGHPVLVTLGIQPARPETAYGYIQSSGQTIEGFCKVKTFTEKPNAELAKVFYESGEFFWNSGLFLWNVRTIIDAFRKFLPDISARFDKGADIFGTPGEHDFISEQFGYCQNISIDYGIMEKADTVYMMCVDFGWADLGTWGSLYDIDGKDASGNANLQKTPCLLYDSSHNIIASDDPSRLMVIDGLEGYIVAESDNVLLICRKENEHRIKQYIADARLGFGKDYN